MDLSKPILSQVVHNKTRKDCKDEAFSGVRRDEISGTNEIWLMGSIARSVSDKQLAINPAALAEAYEDLFQLHPGSVSRER